MVVVVLEFKLQPRGVLLLPKHRTAEQKNAHQRPVTHAVVDGNSFITACRLVLTLQLVSV